MKPIALQIAANDRAQGTCQTFVQIPRSAQTKTEGQMDKEKNCIVPSQAADHTSGPQYIFPA